MQGDGLAQKKEREKITREEGWFIPPIHEKYLSEKPTMNSEADDEE